MLKYYIRALRNYANFSSRAGRKEFWIFFAIFLLLSVFINQQADIAQLHPELLKTPLQIFSTVAGIYLLATFLPMVSVTVRRLHDINRSGWWILLYIIPFAGAIILLIILAGGSSPGENKYGPPQPDDSTRATWPQVKLTLFLLALFFIPIIILVFTYIWVSL